MLKELNINTSMRMELIDISDNIKKIVTESKINNGLCIVFNPHTTAAITINENADPSVQSDIISELKKIIPEKQSYLHSEGNSDAHIKASLIGSDRNIIINNGKLLLGTWQGIYFCEFDGPRNRKIYIKLISD